jgi:prophage antirepressor-like protein
MNTNINIAKNFDGHKIRMAGTPDSPLFAATDICAALDIKNSRDALEKLDADERITVGNADGNPRAGIPHELTYVTESGLYHLIFKSRKESAKRFRRWVTDEVLPSIRKEGIYLPTGATHIDLRAQSVSRNILDLVDSLIKRGVPPQSASGLASNVFRDAVRQPTPTLPSIIPSSNIEE